MPLFFKNYYLLKENEEINNFSFPGIEEFSNSVNKFTNKFKLPDKILDEIQWKWLSKARELFQEKFHHKANDKIRELVPWEEVAPVPLSAIEKALETATSPRKENIHLLLAHGMYNNRRTNNIKQAYIYDLFYAGLPIEFMYNDYIMSYKSYLHFQNVKHDPEVKGIIDKFKDNPYERTNAAVLADKLQQLDHPEDSPILSILRGDHNNKKYAYNHFIFK